MQEAHNLMPESLRAQLPALYAQEQSPDPTVWVKYFTPDSSWTWYATEYSPEDQLFVLWLGGGA